MADFVFSQPKTATVVIKCKPLNSNGVGYREAKFTAVIKKLYGADRQKYLEEIEGKGLPTIVQELVIGLPDIKDEDGNEMPFTEELLYQVSMTDWMSNPLAIECMAVQDSMHREAMARKNS
ncbi:MAG: hypothetical protein AB9Q17_02330 [Candidatus Reddybacter sp.]